MQGPEPAIQFKLLVLLTEAGKASPLSLNLSCNGEFRDNHV